MDELTTDYVVDEIVARSNGLISGEEVLEYSPNCMEGCGILGAAAQYLIDRDLYVKEEIFRSIYKDITKAFMKRPDLKMVSPREKKKVVNEFVEYIEKRFTKCEGKRRIIDEYARLLNCTKKVRYRTKPLKTKAASANLEKNEVVLNKYLLDLGEDVVRYLILHELIHLKLVTVNHGKSFMEMLYKFMPPAQVEEVQNKIMDRLLKVNGLKSSVQPRID